MDAVHIKMQIELHPNEIPEDLKKYFIPKRKYGPFILRNDIVWKKPSCMPSSAKDRFTIDWEHILFFVSNKKYYFNQIKEPSKYEDRDKRRKYGYNGKKINDGLRNEIPERSAEEFAKHNCPDYRNKRCVWEVNPKGTKKESDTDHYAVFPEKLIWDMILAGCPEFVCNKCGKTRQKIQIKIGTKEVPPIGGIKHSKDNSSNFNETYTGNTEQNIYREELSNCGCNAGFSGGIVLDPFFGSGTTGVVALKQNKQFIGIELNEKYCEIAKRRLLPYLEQRKL